MISFLGGQNSALSVFVLVFSCGAQLSERELYRELWLANSVVVPADRTVSIEGP